MTSTSQNVSSYQSLAKKKKRLLFYPEPGYQVRLAFSLWCLNTAPPTSNSTVRASTYNTISMSCTHIVVDPESIQVLDEMDPVHLRVSTPPCPNFSLPIPSHQPVLPVIQQLPNEERASLKIPEATQLQIFLSWGQQKKTRKSRTLVCYPSSSTYRT